MAKEIKQVIVGITREGDIVVKSGRGKMYPVKLAADVKFGCERFFQRCRNRIICHYRY